MLRQLQLPWNQLESLLPLCMQLRSDADAVHVERGLATKARCAQQILQIRQRRPAARVAHGHCRRPSSAVQCAAHVGVEALVGATDEHPTAHCHVHWRTRRGHVARVERPHHTEK